MATEHAPWRDLSTIEYRATRGRRMVGAEMPLELHAQLAALAARDDVSVSQVIRRAVRQLVALERLDQDAA